MALQIGYVRRERGSTAVYDVWIGSRRYGEVVKIVNQYGRPRWEAFNRSGAPIPGHHLTRIQAARALVAAPNSDSPV